MKKYKWLIGSLALLLIAAGFVWAFMPSPVEVEMASVERGPFTLVVEEDGVTRVRDRYVVAAPVSGMLLRPTLRVGDRVKTGDTVGVIVPNAAQMLDARTRAELAARVEGAAAQAARAGALVRQTQAAAAQAANEQRRLEELGTQGFASKTERERATLELDLRRKDAEAAVFEEDAARHDLEQARAAMRESDGSRPSRAWILRAPIDGTVLDLVQESESPVAVGAPVLEVGDLRRLEARIDVLSTEATQIEPQAYVELDAGGVKLAGRVQRIEPSGYTKVSALGIEEQRVDVLVDLLPNPAAERVADGFRVDAVIEVAREEDVLRIPVAALFRDGDDWATYRIEEGRAMLTRVRLGRRGGENAVVVGGLTAGARVIVYPSDAVHDGTRVQLREATRLK